MPDQLQLRGGTTSEHNSFTGALREVTVDTTKKTLVVHDGSQAGGTPLMKESGTVDPTTITIGTGGTQRLAISNSEVVLNDTGADVDFRVESDTNTHALFLNAGNSRIGVNKSAPDYALDVDGDIGGHTVRLLGATPGIRFTDTADTGGFGHVGVNNNSGSLVMRSDDGNALGNTYMGFEVDGGEKMRILNNGFVNVGTTAQYAKFTVQATSQAIGSEGTVKLQADANGADVGAGITFGNNTARRAAILGAQEGTHAIAGYLAFGSRGTSGDIVERMRIDSAGRLIIGNSVNTFTGVGSSRLQVSGTGADTAGANLIRVSNDGGGAYLQFTKNRGSATQTNDTVGAISWMGHDGTDVESYFAQILVKSESVATNNNTTGSIRFGTSNGSSVTSERMRLTHDGKLGIGTTTVGEKLTLGDGDLKFFHSNAGSAHRTTFIEFGNSSNRITSEMNYGADNSSNYTAGLKFTTKNFNGSSFQTVDALNIQANGNVGIGNTSVPYALTVRRSNPSGGRMMILGSNGTHYTSAVSSDSSGLIVFRARINVAANTTTDLVSGFGGSLVLITIGNNGGDDVQQTRIRTHGWNSTSELFLNNYGANNPTITFSTTSGVLKVNHNHTGPIYFNVTGLLVSGQQST